MQDTATLEGPLACELAGEARTGDAFSFLPDRPFQNSNEEALVFFRTDTAPG